MDGARERLIAEAENTFQDETFTRLDLNGAQLSGKEFYRCRFSSCKMQETVWDRSRLEDCVFDGCDLTRLQPKRLGLRGVEFKHCKLMGIDWTDVGANPSVTFTDSSLRYAAFVSIKLRATAFVRCAVVEANFAGTDLAKSRFTECDLAETRFDGCDLTGVDFSSSRALYFEPSKNRVKATRIPLETAVLIANSLGLVVSGFSDAVAGGGGRER